MIRFPKAYADAVAKLRVPSGFALVAAFAYFSTPSWPSLAAGLPLSALGLTLRAWAAGHLEKDVRLAQSGPYAHVRNPLYLGTLLVAAGFAIASRRSLLAALFAGVFVLVYLPVIQLEEQHLRELFGSFQSYEKQAPALWPAFGGAVGGPAPGPRFSWLLYRRNREYQALLAFCAGAALLAAKIFFS